MQTMRVQTRNLASAAITCLSNDESRSMSDSAVQMLAAYLLGGVALLDQRSPDRARCNSIHSDTPADQVRPKPLCESGHGTLHVQHS